MYRLFTQAERSRQKRRLELSLAGLCELELLKQRHETLILSALTLHAPDGPMRDDCSPRRPPDISWSLMNILQHQVGELRMDAEDSSVEPPADAGGSRLSSGDVLAVGCEMSRVQTPVPLSLSAPHLPLEGITEGIGKDEWTWRSRGTVEKEPAAEDYRQNQSMETYILSLMQRRSLPLRSNKPRTSLGPESRVVVRQSSLCRKESPYSPECRRTSPSPERHMWACCSPDEEQNSVHYSKPALAGVHSTSLDFPCGRLDPSSSEPESSLLYQQPPSPSSDEHLVNAQYIPAQPCHAQAKATAHRPHVAPKPTCSADRSPDRKIKATLKKCRFTEEKFMSKKPGRKACRAQSENSLLGQRVLERKCNTVERDAGRTAQPKTRRAQGGSGHRRWHSTLELSQDEAELPPEQPIRRSRKPRPTPPSCGYSQPLQHHHQPHFRPRYPQRTPLCLPEELYMTPVPGESESSLSEAESPVSSSLSSDSDESGGLVWPQQLPPQLAPHSPPTGAPLQPKAFVKIKASHALKKKILRFRTGSLKVMTTV